MSFAVKDEGSPLAPQQYQDYEMSFMDNPRRPKFSHNELEALVEGISIHKNVLLPPNGAPAYRSTNNARQKCWKDITSKVNAVADSNVVRTLPEVVKRWRYLKSRTRVKARRVARSNKSLNDIQRRVMEIAGEKENAPVEDNGEDGWDEVYEIDVGDVTVGDMYEDEYEEHEIAATNQPSSVRYVSTDASVVKSQQMTQSTSANHVVNNVCHNAMQTSEVSSLPVQNKQAPRFTRNNSSFEQAPHSSNHLTGYERAPPHENPHSTNPLIRSENERHADKNNVNITVQSCLCHHSNQSKTVDEQRLEIEKERLGLERQRLEIERQRLEIERERLEIEKKLKRFTEENCENDTKEHN